MPRFVFRIVAVFLVPCLLLAPVSAASLTIRGVDFSQTADTFPHPNMNSFAVQALQEELVASEKHAIQGSFLSPKLHRMASPAGKASVGTGYSVAQSDLLKEITSRVSQPTDRRLVSSAVLQKLLDYPVVLTIENVQKNILRVGRVDAQKIIEAMNAYLSAHIPMESEAAVCHWLMTAPPVAILTF